MKARIINCVNPESGIHEFPIKNDAATDDIINTIRSQDITSLNTKKIPNNTSKSGKMNLLTNFVSIKFCEATELIDLINNINSSHIIELTEDVDYMLKCESILNNRSYQKLLKTGALSSDEIIAAYLFSLIKWFKETCLNFDKFYTKYVFEEENSKIICNTFRKTFEELFNYLSRAAEQIKNGEKKFHLSIFTLLPTLNELEASFTSENPTCIPEDKSLQNIIRKLENPDIDFIDIDVEKMKKIASDKEFHKILYGTLKTCHKNIQTAIELTHLALDKELEVPKFNDDDYKKILTILESDDAHSALTKGLLSEREYVGFLHFRLKINLTENTLETRKRLIEVDKHLKKNSKNCICEVIDTGLHALELAIKNDLEGKNLIDLTDLNIRDRCDIWEY
ncbi:MAG: hypothetical protein IJE14_05850 [Clostridia bacterium]|nr:hypothetical protein [Clostridia bacterium]